MSNQEILTTNPDQVEIRHELKQFTGTEYYYKYLGNILLTDGAKFLAEKYNCYWLFDIIASLKYVPRCKNENFIVCKLNLDKTGATESATFLAEDGNGNILFSQYIEYTDFKIDSITLFFYDNVILLPSEY